MADTEWQTAAEGKGYIFQVKKQSEAPSSSKWLGRKLSAKSGKVIGTWSMPASNRELAFKEAREKAGTGIPFI